MKVEVLYFEGCPNHPLTVELVRKVFADLGLAVKVNEVEVKNADDANRLRFLGSPSVHVDGLDVEPEVRDQSDYAFGCRIYGASGVPSRELIESALKERATSATEGQDCCAPVATLPAASARGKNRLLTPATGVLAALGASACCWVPLLLGTVGLSAVGAASFFATYRPLFVGLAVVLLGIGFYQMYVRKSVCSPASTCETSRGSGGRFAKAMLWVATVFAATLIFFPSYVAYLWRPQPPAGLKAGPGRTVLRFQVGGMTCEGCAVVVENAIAAVPGVQSVAVSFEKKKAEVAVDADPRAIGRQITQAVEAAGFGAESQQN